MPQKFSDNVVAGNDALADEYNNLRKDVLVALGLVAGEQDTPDLTLQVTAGVVSIQGTIVKFAGGNSPSFTAPSSDPRIDLLSIDDTGTLNITTGVEAASPTVPTFPVDEFVIAEVFNRVGQTTVLNETVAGEGFIQRDPRPHTAGGLNKLAQIITGIKTFLSIPVLPAIDPTTDNQATRKKYVDDKGEGSGIYGDGSDGDLTISSPTTLSSDKFFNNLTVNDGETLDAGGFRIFVKNTLTLSGTGKIARNGNNGNNGGNGSTNLGGSGGSGGSAISGNTLPGGNAGRFGGSGGGSTTNGSNGDNGVNVSPRALGVNGSVGGVGGTGGESNLGGGNPGGNGGFSSTAISSSIKLPPRYLPQLIQFVDFDIALAGGDHDPYQGSASGGGSGGGGGGRQTGGPLPGGGGGGGAGSGSVGATVMVIARIITGTGTIEVLGGTGGDGGNGAVGPNFDTGGGAGGAGGNGGTGGVLLVVYNLLTTVTFDVSGGAGGAKGIGAAGGGGAGGAGTDGAVGVTGPSGTIIELQN